MALEIAIDWVNSLDKDLIKQLPLLKILHEIIFEGKDAKSALDGFVQVMRKRFKNQEVF